jgi:hypothetical protein
VNPEAAVDSLFSPRPIVAFTGPFGSGKTEVAIGYALASLARGRPTCIIDLDVVTAYFRVGDYRQELQARGLQVIAPPGPYASFELPALPPEIAGAMKQEGLHVVLDVGGDPAGSQLLRAYAAEISARTCDIWLVANPFRPSCATPAALVEQARAIEESSTLPLTGLVANPNLGRLTTAEHLRSGWETVCRTADELALPLVFFAVADSLADRRPASSVPALPLSQMLRLPWEPA